MVRVLIKSEGKFPIKKQIIKKAVVNTLKANEMKGNFEVSVSVVGEGQMDKLSQKYMKDGKKHQVLSFPLEDRVSPDGILRLGDIIFCYPQILLAAKRDGAIVDDEIYSLTVHSTEHLLGKHHEIRNL